MKYLAYFMLYGVLGMIAALILYTFLFELAKLIIYKAIGGTFNSFVFLFFNIKNENGKIVFKSTNPQLLAACKMTPPQDLSEQKDNVFGLIAAALPVVLLIIASVIAFSLAPLFVKVMLIESAVVSALFFLFILMMVAKGKDNSPMASYMNKAEEYQKQLKDGIRPAAFTVEDEEPEVKHYGTAAELQPILYRYWHYLDRCEYDKLAPYAEIFDKSFPGFYNSSYNSVIFELIFYLAFIKKDSIGAQNLVGIMNGDLEAAKDSSGRRIYAYYLYYTNKGRDRALQTAKDGLENIGHYRNLYGAAADMERDLLTNLIETIEKEQN